MRKILLLLTILITLFYLPQRVARAVDNCDATYTDENGKEIGNFIYRSVEKLNYSFILQNPVLDKTYTVKACNMSPGVNLNLPNTCSKVEKLKANPNGILTGPPLNIFDIGKYSPGLEVTVELQGAISTICKDTFSWEEAPTPTPAKGISCFLDIKPRNNISYTDTITLIGKIKVFGMKNYGLTTANPRLECFGQTCGQITKIHISGKGIEKDIDPQLNITIDGKPDNSSFIADLQSNYQKGRYKATALAHVKDTDTVFDFVSTTCSLEFDVPNGIIPTPTPTLTPTVTPKPTIPAVCGGLEGFKAQERGDCSDTYKGCPWCITPTPKSAKRPRVQIPDLKPLCLQLDPKFQEDCRKCDKNGEIWSAIGCLPTDFSELIKKYVFTTGVGIAGGIAFLYFLYGAFLILTSSGNAEKMEEAKQIITSSLAGLLLIIFSVFLLSVIGVQILQLPGFG